MKKPIAMLCNKEQFEAIKPKLKKKGISIKKIDKFKNYEYLTNIFAGEKNISNISKDDISGFKYCEEIHETWNERIFLEACGIETQETFEITKETIVKYKMKDEFPEVFKVKLDVGKWYKHKSGTLSFKTGDKSGYGFDYKMNFETDVTSYSFDSHAYNWKKATEQEVFEALKKEAVRRGYKEGVYIHRPFCDNLNDCIIDKNNFPKDMDFYYSFKNDYLEHYGFVVYSKGQWAKIIQTKTKEEAEKLLNCKIV